VVEQLQAEVERASNELTQRQSALDLSRRRQEDLNRQLVQLGTEKEQIEEDLTRLRESVSLKQEDYEGLDARFETIANEAEDLGSRVVTLRQSHSEDKRQAEMKRREFVELTQKSSQSYSRTSVGPSLKPCQ
jgi:chromosome segregation ATPase